MSKAFSRVATVRHVRQNARNFNLILHFGINFDVILQFGMTRMQPNHTYTSCHACYTRDTSQKGRLLKIMLSYRIKDFLKVSFWPSKLQLQHCCYVYNNYVVILLSMILLLKTNLVHDYKYSPLTSGRVTE